MRAGAGDSLRTDVLAAATSSIYTRAAPFSPRLVLAIGRAWRLAELLALLYMFRAVR